MINSGGKIPVNAGNITSKNTVTPNDHVLKYTQNVSPIADNISPINGISMHGLRRRCRSLQEPIHLYK